MDKHFMRNQKFIKGLEALIEQLPKNCVMAELGSFAGESTALFAQHCQSVHAVDLWQGSLCTAGIKSEETASDIEKRFDEVVKKYPTRIAKVKQSTHDAYQRFKNNTLDFVYIDALHTREAVKKDLELWLPKIKVNGFVGGHDYNPTQFPGVVQAVNEFFGEEYIQVFEDTSWLAKVSDEKISVLMPVFNRQKYVRDAIKSILNQSHKNLELIIYDDGSKDKSLDICKEFATTDKRITLISDDTNKGIIHSRNKLLEACTSRVACWMDSDDLSNKYRLEKQLLAIHSGKIIVLSNSNYFKENTEVNLIELPEKRALRFKCRIPCFPNGFSCEDCTPCGMFVVNKEIKFLRNPDPKVNEHIGEDCYWISRMLTKDNWVVLEDIVYFLREHPERITRIIDPYVTKSDGRPYEQILRDWRKHTYGIDKMPLYTTDDKFTDYGGKTSKRAIVTIVTGSFHRFLATLTHYYLKNYAAKVKADFIILTNDDKDSKSCCWLKYKMKDLLSTYDRILYIDTDIIVNDKTPDLFDIVPEDSIGCYNEITHSRTWVDCTYPKYISAVGENPEKWYDGTFYMNAGLMLFGRQHSKLFTLPTTPEAFKHDWDLMGDQSWFNMNVQRYKLKVHDLGVPYNAMVRELREGKIFGTDIKDIHIFHFAGMFITIQNYDYTEQVITNLLEQLDPKKKIEVVKTPEDQAKWGVGVRCKYSYMMVRIKGVDIHFCNYEARCTPEQAQEIIKYQGYSLAD